MKPHELLPELGKRSGVSLEAKRKGMDTYPCVWHRGTVLMAGVNNPCYDNIKLTKKFIVCPVCGWEVEDGGHPKRVKGFNLQDHRRNA